MTRKILICTILAAALALSGCGRLGFGQGNEQGQTEQTGTQPSDTRLDDEFNFDGAPRPRNTISELLSRPPVENQVPVNRYIWQASLQVLDFLPIQTIDPFTGVIVTGFGTPPGGGRAYRATVLVDDPALEARSLKVSMQTRSGAVSTATVRAIEDAILTRARQLRVADSRL